VFVIDSKGYRGHLHSSSGRLWHGRRPLDRTLDTSWWEATQVAEALGFGPDLHIYPVLCVHVARLPWLRELLVDGIPILAPGALRPALRERLGCPRLDSRTGILDLRDQVLCSRTAFCAFRPFRWAWLGARRGVPPG
jgi:hypothetical protein